MRIRHLISDIRHALRVSKISCELSDADLEAMLRESVDDVGDRRRTHCIVECTVAKAQDICREIALHQTAPRRRRSTGARQSKRTKRQPASRRQRRKGGD